MTWIQEKGRLPQINSALKALIDLSSPGSNHKNLLRPNEFLTRPFVTLSSEIPADLAWYTKKNLKQII